MSHSAVLLVQDESQRREQPFEEVIVVKHFTLVTRTSEAYVVISYRHGLPPRVEVQRVLWVQIVNQPEPANYSAVPGPPELRQDLAVGGDRRCGVGIGKGKYGPCRLRASPQVVRRLSCPRDREHPVW